MSDELDFNNEFVLNDIIVRAVNDEERIVEGIAVPYGQTTQIGSMYKERFVRGSVQVDTKQVHLYYNHDKSLPIGQVLEGRDQEDGYIIRARISETSMGNDVYALVKDGTIQKFSIGFIPIEHSVEGGNTVVRTKVSLAEVSLVSQPAYEGADVLSVRSEQDQVKVDSDQIKTSKEKTVSENTVSQDAGFDLEEVRSAVENLERKFEVFAVPAPAQEVVETRSAGEILKSYVSGQDNTLERAYTGGTTADAFMQDGYIGDLTRIVDEAAILRSLFSRGQLPAEGNNIEFAELDTNTVDIDVQTAEGDDLAFGLVSVTSRTAPVKTYGGYTSLSRQEIERASVNMVDHSLRAMAVGAGKALNTVFRAHFEDEVADQIADGNKVVVPAAGATYSDWLDAIIDASANYDLQGLTLDGLIVAKDVFKGLMALEASDGRPVFLVEGAGVNNVGQLNVRTLRGSVANIPVVMDAGLSNGVASFYNAGAITEFTSGVVRLQDDNIINLSRDFSVYMYSAVASTIPTAIVGVEFD